MWRERIAAWSDEVTVHGPAVEHAIRDCEIALGLAMPPELAALLRECDGVDDEYGFGLVWPVQRIKDDNLAFRSDEAFKRLYMPFEPLLFFADEGNGDQFAFVMRDRPFDVFRWDHETDGRVMVAGGLAAYLQGRMEGILED